MGPAERFICVVFANGNSTLVFKLKSRNNMPSMISIKLIAQVPFCYHSIVRNSHLICEMFFIFFSINDFARNFFS